MLKLKNIILSLFLVSPVLLNGCGSSSNNDQGTSFLAVGYSDTTDGTGEVGQVVILSNSLNGVFTSMNLQNRLSQQFIRVTRIDCDYNVPGSAVPVPSNASLLGFVIESGVPTADGGALPTTGIVNFPIVSTDQIDFIIANIGSMPPLPFVMNATCSATGVTQSGDVLVTNSLSYLVQFN
jgi:hypothetical protein